MSVSLATIEEKVELAKAYHLYLTDYDYSQRIAGYCAQYQQKITCLGRLIMALGWDIAGEYNTDVTQNLYKLLMGELSAYSGATLSVDPSVVVPGSTIVIEAGTILQTSVVEPGDTETSYTFTELIGNEVLSVYRGTGTVLRAHSSSPTDEFAQFDSATGELTFLYAFGEGETLWVQYKTTS